VRDSPLTCVASYRRTVAAPIERVWENVFDWEHLPWLHRRRFSWIRRVDSGPWGWRARLDVQPASGRELLLELVRDGEENRYVARTLEGPGSGTEIWTELSPEGDVTRVEVEFHVPEVAAGQSAAQTLEDRHRAQGPSTCGRRGSCSAAIDARAPRAVRVPAR